MQILSTWWNYWCHWCLIAQITFLHDLTLIMQLIFLRLKNMNVAVMICQSASELKGTNKQDHKYVSWQRIFHGTWGVGSWPRFAFCKIQGQDKASSPTPCPLGFFGGRILGFVTPFKTVNLSLIIKTMEIWEESWAFSRDYLLLWNKAGFEKQFSQAPEGWLICHFSTEVNERRSNASKHCPFKDLQKPSNLENKQQDLWVAGSMSGTSK